MATPTQGAFVGASVNVTATATDTVGVQSVQFLLDGSPLGLPDTTAPFGVTWTTAGATGVHTLAARATDAAGNQATSTSISVTIDTTPPSVAVTAPTGRNRLGYRDGRRQRLGQRRGAERPIQNRRRESQRA